MSGTSDRQDPPDARRSPGRLSIHVLVLLATLGIWWLLPDYHQHLIFRPPEESTWPRLGLALAASTVIAVLWGLGIRQLTRPLFAGPGDRGSVVIAVTIGVVLYMLLAVQALWMRQMAGQPAAVIASMDPDGFTTEIPDEPRLLERIAGFYDAMGARDAATMHAMSQMPGERSPQSLAEYRRQMNLGREWSSSRPTTWRMESLETCFCTGWSWWDGSRSQRCVLLLGASTSDRGAPQPQRTFLDTWEYAAGDWYHRCPGPAATHCPPDPYAEGYCRASHVLQADRPGP